MHWRVPDSVLHDRAREFTLVFSGIFFTCVLLLRVSGKTEWSQGAVSSWVNDGARITICRSIDNPRGNGIAPPFRLDGTARTHPQVNAATNKPRNDSQGRALQTESMPRK